MKRFFALALSLLLLLPGLSLAEVTLVTATTFAGYDAAAQDYSDALEAWETQSGNVVDDYSGMPDDAWLGSVSTQLADGTLDLLYTSTQLDDAQLAYFVPVDEILQKYPDFPAKTYAQLAQGDGKIYAMPVRMAWEALYVNTDLFVENNIALPTTWDALLSAVDQLNALGITPIANAISDWPACLVDVAVLAASTPDEYLQTTAAPDGYAKGVNMLHTLYGRGAFGDRAMTWSDTDAEQAFLSRQGAMRVDGEWLGELVQEDQWNNTIILPFPREDGAPSTAMVASATSGFYITRSAWNDDVRREATVSLLKSLLSEPTASTLATNTGDALKNSLVEVFAPVDTLCAPLMDLLDMDAYDAWMLTVGEAIAGNADINETIKAVFP